MISLSNEILSDQVIDLIDLSTKHRLIQEQIRKGVIKVIYQRRVNGGEWEEVDVNEYEYNNFDCPYCDTCVEYRKKYIEA